MSENGRFDLDEYADRFRKLRREWEQTRAAIAGDDRLTPQARRQALAEAHERVMVRHRALKTEFRQAVEAEGERLKRRLFAPRLAPTESREVVYAAYRAAMAEASATPDSKALAALAERARLSDDKLLLRAVVATAVERGDLGLARAYGNATDVDAYIAHEQTFGEHAGGEARVMVNLIATAPAPPGERSPNP